ncbi:MAG: C45 family peptidase [Candidatus Thermoplasmatota archaeon]
MMRKRWLLSFILAMMIAFFISGSFSYKNVDGGWIEEMEGIKVLHISGTNYEMGYQHGFLLKNETKENIRAFLNQCSNYNYLLAMWNITKNYIPEEYIEELRGIADGAEIKFEDVAVAYMTVVTWGMGCFGISAWGNATADGKLYHFRSFDLPMNIKDPITGKYVHENSVLIVRKPKNGYASVSPSFVGSLHGGGGFNEKGIAIGMQTCWSNDSTFYGTPELIKVQMVLDHASRIEEAIDYLIKNGTAGWNFIVSDCKIPIGYVVEVTANHYYVGTHDSAVEAIPPFWQIREVVRRTNFFISPELAATQRSHYDPSGVAGFIRIFTENDPFFVIWRSYKVVSKMVEENYGNFDLNNSMNLFQSTYRGDTDLILKILIKLAEGTSFNRAWNMWVACPETGDFVVSFAERDKIAFSTPCHYFNLFDLIEEP